MGLFKKKTQTTVSELKCPATDCSFTCWDEATLKRHVEWKHPELAKTATK